MRVRECTTCGHSELHHFGHDCAGFTDWQCACPGFASRKLSDMELRVMTEEAMRVRGQIGEASVSDEYSAIREHLAEVMEKASQ